jgi:hypothetical protein
VQRCSPVAKSIAHQALGPQSASLEQGCPAAIVWQTPAALSQVPTRQVLFSPLLTGQA